MSTPRELTPEENGAIDKAIAGAVEELGYAGRRSIAAHVWIAAREFVEGGENQPHLDTSDEAIERGAKALYEAQGKPHGGYESDVLRKGLRYRAFEWDELAKIEKMGPRRHARLVIEAARGGGS